MQVHTLVCFGIIVVTFGLYFFTNFFCNSWCPSHVFGKFDVVYPSLLGLIPTIAILAFFGKKIFLSWIRHIAWWFSIAAVWIISNTSDGFILSPGRNKTALFLTALLFIITLIYALVMRGRYAGESSK